MSSSSNFLFRWSRLKRQAEDKAPRQDAAALEEAAPDVSPATPALDLHRAENPELTPDELTALPRLEDITAETDLAPFMRVGVPASLRNAALRRMWALDPEIRDRVGDALDYAYDWNVPGSVPGSGGLLASDDVQAMLRGIIGAPPAEGRSVGPDAKVDPAPIEHTPPESPLLTAAAKAVDATRREPPPADAPASDDGTGPAPADPGSEVQTAQSPRHGGATPF